MSSRISARDESAFFKLFFFGPGKCGAVAARTDAADGRSRMPPRPAAAGNYFCKVVDIVKTRD